MGFIADLGQLVSFIHLFIGIELLYPLRQKLVKI